jgi:hypothetical protein
MVLYFCVLIVFSLHQESLNQILLDESLPEGVPSQLVIRASLRQHIEVPKNHNYALSVRIVSPHKDYSSFLRWQANIFVHNTSSELCWQMYVVILVCYFFCYF